MSNNCCFNCRSTVCDLHNLWVEFGRIGGKAEIGQVYYVSESDVYVVIKEMQDYSPAKKGIVRELTIDIFASYAWDEELRRFIGTGYMQTNYQTYYENGDFKEGVIL